MLHQRGLHQHIQIRILGPPVLVTQYVALTECNILQAVEVRDAATAEMNTNCEATDGVQWRFCEAPFENDALL